MLRFSRVLAAVALGVAASTPVALSAQVRMTVPPQSERIALRGATIHTVTNGVIQNGTIIFEAGKITAVGANIPIPAGTKTVDVTGKHIYPGLIDAYSSVGISVIGVLIFAGLTAYDTQKLKEMYLYGNFDTEAAAKVSVYGALQLYLDFINMFQFLLALLGNRNE